ncbi:MAG: adenylate/guanylate cyclase domain-containing protein [Chthoniobacterales bacterium]
MPDEVTKRIALEIAHVLFIDVIGYSKLSINDQRAALDELTAVVRGSEHFQKAEAADKLIRIPTGDGMALVFYTSPDAPVECAIEIDRALRNHPRLRLRMGVHSGPVSGVIDVNERANVAGAGINLAQRVMDCGDAGHILLSKHVAEDLAEFEEWRSALHNLGMCEVKHGVRVCIVNLYCDDFGNPALPKKFKLQRKRRARMRWAALALGLVLLGAIVAGSIILSRRSTPATALVPEKSIAVLPFENLSSEKENAYFADGVQDEILTNLAKIADLKVISRTSVMQYKTSLARNLREIGRQLGVAHLLEGSVQRAAGKVRVNAQLIDARTDAHSWAENYDRPLDDVFAIQSEIAKTIADQLRAKLSPSEKAAIDKPDTTDLAAYDLYLRARSLFADSSNQVQARPNLMQAARFLDEAVSRDPQFLVAWCLLSRVHGNIYWDGFDHTPARLEMANAAVQTALHLQPDSGEAHLALADYYYHGFRNYDRARTELAQARRTLPNSAEVFEYTAYIDRRQGRWQEATRNLERALELDPRNFFTLQQMALFYQWQRRYADEARTYDRALKIVPGDAQTRILRAAVATDWRADIKPYEETLAALIAENPGIAPDVDDPFYSLCERTPAAAARVLANYPTEGVVNNGVNFPKAYWEGVVARWQNDPARAQAAFTGARAEVEKIVEKQPDFAAALSLLGMIDAGLGRKEEALREGRRACELLPMTSDAVDGANFAVNLAQIYTWIGEKTLATEQLAAIERVPNQLSYGFLKLQPQWDPLRGDAAFEKIVASLAP